MAGRARALWPVAIAIGVATASCTSGGKATNPPPAAPQAADAKATPDLPGITTTVQYAGTYDEKLDYTASSQFGQNTISEHVHFSFREAVTLETKRNKITGKPISNAPVSDSADNPLTFQDTGTMTYTDSHATAQNCTASYSGVSGVGGWNSSGGQPPVEIIVAALKPDGSKEDTYKLQISAAMPTGGASTKNPNGSRIIKTTIDSGGDAGNSCDAQGVLGNLDDAPAIYGNADFLHLLRPGPRENPLLVLPLDTQDYTKHYSVDQTAPFTFSGASGTDVVSAGATLSVNGKGSAYAALGDSFASGDFPQFQDDACLRSEKAYPLLYDSKATFLACKGYASSAVTEGQVPGISANAKVVSVTAGGDDVNLFQILVTCVLFQLDPMTCEDHFFLPSTTDFQLIARFQLVLSNLEAMFDAIKVQAPDAKVYILGYPDPFPETFTVGSCPALEQSTYKGVSLPFGVARTDLDFFKFLIDRLNQVVEQAADAKGATYVKPDPAFAQHGICSVDPWFFPLTAPDPEKLHPNETGHQVLEKELFAAAGPAPD